MNCSVSSVLLSVVLNFQQFFPLSLGFIHFCDAVLVCEDSASAVINFFILSQHSMSFIISLANVTVSA